METYKVRVYIPSAFYDYEIPIESGSARDALRIALNKAKRCEGDRHAPDTEMVALVYEGIERLPAITGAFDASQEEKKQ